MGFILSCLVWVTWSTITHGGGGISSTLPFSNTRLIQSLALLHFIHPPIHANLQNTAMHSYMTMTWGYNLLIYHNYMIHIKKTLKIFHKFADSKSNLCGKQNKPLLLEETLKPWVQQVALIASHFLFMDKPIPGNTIARICSKLGWMQSRLITDGLNFHVARFVFVIGGGFSESATQKGRLFMETGDIQKTRPFSSLSFAIVHMQRPERSLTSVESVPFLAPSLLFGCSGSVPLSTWTPAPGLNPHAHRTKCRMGMTKWKMEGKRRVSPIKTQRPTNMWGGQECILITLAFCLSFHSLSLNWGSYLKVEFQMSLPMQSAAVWYCQKIHGFITLSPAALYSTSDILLQRAMGSEGTSVWLQSAFKQLMLQWELEMLMRPVRNHQIRVKHWSSVKTTIHQPNNQHR